MDTQIILDSIQAVNDSILANESMIESLDREIGDGDHFINVRRGCAVLVGMREELAPLPPSEAFQRIGMKLMSTIGGASGPLFARFFLAMGKTLKGNDKPDGAAFAQAFSNGVDAIRQLGRADLGEKTMLDVLIPAARLLLKLTGANVSLGEIVEQMKADTERTMLGTKNTIATKGRAHFLGDRALGHIDPGSKTCQVAIWAVCDLLTSNASV
jgi:phosphoenolpyruvate---glycerone phosphotransferase subunit DhaL